MDLHCSGFPDDFFQGGFPVGKGRGAKADFAAISFNCCHLDPGCILRHHDMGLYATHLGGKGQSLGVVS